MYVYIFTYIMYVFINICIKIITGTELVAF